MLITHDLSVVRHMADRIVVMYLGKVAEAGSTDVIFGDPSHPYTDALLGASPDVTESADVPMRSLEGSVPDPARPPQGWELDDVVRWLQDQEGMFDRIAGVERDDAFSGTLAFEDEESANALAGALRTDDVPSAMRSALQRLEVSGTSVHLGFKPVDEVMLTQRGPGHEAACVLDALPGAAD